MASPAGKVVEISQEEYDELKKLKESQGERRKTSKARSSARAELIKKYKSEYDGLVTKFGGKT